MNNAFLSDVKIEKDVMNHLIQGCFFSLLLLCSVSCIPFGGQSERDRCINGDIAAIGAKSSSEMACAGTIALKNQSESALILCLIELKKLDRCKSESQIRYPYILSP